MDKTIKEKIEDLLFMVDEDIMDEPKQRRKISEAILALIADELPKARRCGSLKNGYEQSEIIGWNDCLTEIRNKMGVK